MVPAAHLFAQENNFDEIWGNRHGIPVTDWVATASIDSDQAQNGIDNDPDTEWTAKTAAGDYFQVDLGAVYPVKRLEWYTDGANLHDGWGQPEKEGAYPEAFRIDVSVDGESWTTVVDMDGKGAFEPGEHLLQAIWSPVDAQYVRVIQTEDQESSLHLTRLLVWHAEQEIGVTIQNHWYFPDYLLVAAGTTVTWLQRDFDPHTVTQGTPETMADALFNSAGDDWSVLDWGETYSFTFTENVVGELRYFCIPHPNMVGYVKVVNLGS